MMHIIPVPRGWKRNNHLKRIHAGCGGVDGGFILLRADIGGRYGIPGIWKPRDQTCQFVPSRSLHLSDSLVGDTIRKTRTSDPSAEISLDAVPLSSNQCTCLCLLVLAWPLPCSGPDNDQQHRQPALVRGTMWIKSTICTEKSLTCNSKIFQCFPPYHTLAS